LLNYLKSLNLRPLIVFNKADKLSNNKIKTNLERAKIVIPYKDPSIFVVSAKTGKGVADFINKAICPLIESN